jgi:hypothetical protein
MIATLCIGLLSSSWSLVFAQQAQSQTMTTSTEAPKMEEVANVFVAVKIIALVEVARGERIGGRSASRGYEHNAFGAVVSSADAKLDPAAGYSEQGGKPYHGYYFKVLKGQGPAAPMGQMDFVVKDAMIGGFALAAAPAQYGVTGVQTFMVSHDGVVYEKDLGPDTLKTFKNLDRFNPDKTWHPTNDQW